MTRTEQRVMAMRRSLADAEREHGTAVAEVQRTHERVLDARRQLAAAEAEMTEEAAGVCIKDHVEINLNDEVHFQLTDDGRRWYAEWAVKIDREMQEACSARGRMWIRVTPREPHRSDLGREWFRMQLWEFAAVFGPHLGVGMEGPTNMNMVRLMVPWERKA